MPRQSAVYEVLIASPSDVLTERRVLAEVLEDWNSAHSRSRAISLQALRWELDGVPASGARPQEILNKQLVENADILMAVFGARLGTPTGQAASGTVEEIEHFRRQGKPVLLYFSEADIPHNHDAEQFRLLAEYRKSLEVHTFYQTFRDVEELRRRATRDLAHTINTLALGPTKPIREKAATNQSEFASVSLQAQNQGMIPSTTVKVVRVYGTIENHSASKRIREYSCTLSIPKCCLTFNTAIYPAEVESRDMDYRKFRHTEAHHSRVSIHPGDRFQIIAVEMAVGHLAQEDREKCVKMDVIADATADGEALQARKTVAELMGI